MKYRRKNTATKYLKFIYSIRFMSWYEFNHDEITSLITIMDIKRHITTYYGQILNMPIYITNKTYIYSQYEPDKIRASESFLFWRCQPFSILISKEAVKQPYCLRKNAISILKIFVLPAYILTYKFRDYS